MRQHLRQYWQSATWSVAAAVLTLALAVQVTAHRGQEPEHTHGSGLHFTWEFHPKSFQEARDKATLIVLADVVAVERGPDAVVQVQGLPNNEDRMPMQHITVKVAKAYRGEAASGQTLAFTQSGGGDVGFSEDSPPYKVGERYVLLLRPGRPNMYRIVSPEGRYRITARGIIEPMPVADPNNAAVRDLRGNKPLAVLERLITVP